MSLFYCYSTVIKISVGRKAEIGYMKVVALHTPVTDVTSAYQNSSRGLLDGSFSYL